VPTEDAGEKTEAPTPRRRQEARERGQVATSQDLTAAVALLGATMVPDFAGLAILRDLIELMRTMLAYRSGVPGSTNSVAAACQLAAGVLASTAAPVCLAFMAVATLTTVAQVGLLFTLHPITPDLSKINPIAGLGRMFSMQSLMRLVTSLFKVSLIGAVAFFTIRARLPQLVNMSGLSTWAIVGLAGELMFVLGVRMALVLLIIAIIDYAYQRHRHEQGLRMTKQEVKEEMRRLEGDPLVRERRRRVGRQLAMQRMQAAVPKSDVVVTNPTELAIAIKYDPQVMAAPKVVAKGADLIAQRIRKLAIEHGVPIVERKPLAQALHRTVDVGQEIPPAFYKAVAEILAYVYELSGKSVFPGSPATGT